MMKKISPILASAKPKHSRDIYRFAFVTRLTHALLALSLSLLFLSGMQIFIAHPALYWGVGSDFAHPLLKMEAVEEGEDESAEDVGITTILGHQFTTTGLLGVTSDEQGELAQRALPAWLTLPAARDLATGRLWHFFLAWTLVFTGTLYLVHSLATRHIQRDLIPTKNDWRGTYRSILDHAKLRHPTGDEAARYNILQRLAYLAVVFGLVPAMVFTGLALSPKLAALLGPLVDSLGGHQAMRTVHFVVTLGLVGFVAVHLFQVAISGLANNLRAMTTGWFRIDRSKEVSREQA